MRRTISAGIRLLFDMSNAREIALRALIACRQSGAWSDGVLKELLRGADRRDAALASRLCYGVLQNRMLLDFQIASFVQGKKLQPVVEEILRLAVYQITKMDRIPASAAVNEAVEQTKRHANAHAARLVNGVLRNMLRAQNLPIPQELSLRYSHPAELTKLLCSQYGAEKTERLLQSHNEIPPTVLQVNSLCTDLNAVQTALEAAGAECSVHPWLADCLTVSGTGNLEALQAFHDGWFYVQDAAAKLAVLAADIQPGMQVLDCCAAPGGKSFAAAIQMKNRGRLISCDIHPHKLKLIENGAARLGLSVLQTRLQNASQPVREWYGTMDAVLADVPCSGLGVIRKKPDIRYKDLRQTERLPEIQIKILEQQAHYVRDGGILLYSTCTILRRENEEIAENFLRRHPEFEAETVRFPQNSGIPDAAMTTLLPCDHGTDGFFICKFRRRT